MCNRCPLSFAVFFALFLFLFISVLSIWFTFAWSFHTVLTKYVKTAEMLYGRVVRVWVLIFPFFAITNPEDLQTVLSSKKHTEKIFFYKLLHNFLGNGLITSSGKKKTKKLKVFILMVLILLCCVVLCAPENWSNFIENINYKHVFNDIQN